VFIRQNVRIRVFDKIRSGKSEVDELELVERLRDFVLADTDVVRLQIVVNIPDGVELFE
jgi:cytochrome c-type biogenesis protein CcmH/NrfF